MKFLITIALSTCAWAQIGVDRPQIGKMLDANGAVRTVFGMTASVSLGEIEIPGVLSSACSKTYCLAKTATSIVSAKNVVDVPSGPALFAFDGDAAFVWFVRSRKLGRWQDGTLTFLPRAATLDGEVLSMRANAGTVEFAVRRRNGIWIVDQDGTVVDALPDSQHVMLLAEGVVYATADEVIIREIRFPLPGVTSFAQMSARYLQVRAEGVDYTLCIEKGREALFQLPGISQ